MIQLTHLTVAGQNLPPATIDLAAGTSVVHGPSDTGKSFIVDAIDFALGSSGLKEIPELLGYTHVMLGVRSEDGRQVTLARPIASGRIGIYPGDLREAPEAPPEQSLATKHNAATTDNLSRFLLALIGLDEKRIRKNVRNETVSLSFRHLAHFSIVDETQMQSEVSPVFTGNVMSRTAELSVLKLLLEGNDDSSLEAVESNQDRNRLKAAKAEVIESMISELEHRLDQQPSAEELKDQLANLNSSIAAQSSSLDDSSASRSSALREVADEQDLLAKLRAQFTNNGALKARLSLLDEQYSSDLSRLEMIGEAGSLLGFFDTSTCPFCGSDALAPHDTSAVAHSTETPFADSVESEMRKTELLRADLLLTLDELQQEQNVIRDDFAASRSRLAERQTALAELDANLRPVKSEIRMLVEARSTVESALALWAQLDSLKARLTAIMAETAAETAAAATAIGLLTIDAFSAQISALLAEWGFPDADTVRYDRSEQDIVAGGQLRAAHGKGVRAILHAAFSIALAQYCVARDLPHPGFVVLDSPLVTYRPPTHDEPVGEDEDLPVDFTARFYASVEAVDPRIQVIVMENVAPPDNGATQISDIAFSKSAASQVRYGFFAVARPLTE